MAENSKLVLITGAAKRIGKSIALDLASHGYDIAIHYNKAQDEAFDLKSEIEFYDVECDIFQADLSRFTSPKKLIDTVCNKMGVPHILINNASVFEPDDIVTLSEQSYEKHMNINLRSPLFLVKELAERIGKKASGNVINIVDQRVLNLTPQYLSYTLSKTALHTLTTTLAQNLAPNIRVNAIGPGPTLRNVRQSDVDFNAEACRTLLGKGPALSELSEAIRFILAVPSMTGQMITLDGGQHLEWKINNE
ncbi:MAG: SDR family oxidoreductase [Rhizobiales bacterium]|nr:SDR family oxidoreductase [Hyphomicrobiales bacterium]